LKPKGDLFIWLSKLKIEFDVGVFLTVYEFNLIQKW